MGPFGAECALLLVDWPVLVLGRSAIKRDRGRDLMGHLPIRRREVHLTLSVGAEAVTTTVFEAGIWDESGPLTSCPHRRAQARPLEPIAM